MTPHTHKVCPPGSCPLPRSPSEGPEGRCCRHPCHAAGHTDLSLSPRNAVAVLSTEGQSSASTESGYQIKCYYSRAKLLLFHFIHDFADVPGNAKGLLFPTAKVPLHDGDRNISPTLPLMGARSAWSRSAPAAPQLEKAGASRAYSFLCQSNSGEGKSHREKGGEWWWVHGAQSLYIILQVGNKIRLRGHVPWVIYKHNVCTRSRMRFSFQQKQWLLLVICPTSRLRDCPSHIRESVKAHKNILNQFWNPHSWGMVLPPTS